MKMLLHSRHVLVRVVVSMRAAVIASAIMITLEKTLVNMQKRVTLNYLGVGTRSLVREVVVGARLGHDVLIDAS